ncbi:MAG: HypC/HybG/HupF family hydrogenase formation chaperone [Pseudomonadales bacterium]|nr:HypC/HybG/HupF family hydrogenase formation chaperone [Pseudomonadales bacterium]
MCLGIPTQIIEITNADSALAVVELGGVRREVNVALLVEELPLDQLIGQWAIVHAGFAIGLVDEDEAQQTLATISDWEREEPAS